MSFQSAPVRNRILSHLPPVAFEMLQHRLQRIQLKRHEILQESQRPVGNVYFIERGVAIILARTQRDGHLGVGLVGRLGLVGVPAVLGTMRSPHRGLVEVEGEALRVGSADLKLAMDEYPAVRQPLMNYIQALLVQNSQTVLCNARHELEQRLARWLLLARDRLDDSIIPLTHDLFSMMLGAWRPGVTNALADLEHAGALRRRRGAVEITDRAMLEQRTCQCYWIIAGEYQRLVDSEPAVKSTPSCAVAPLA